MNLEKLNESLELLLTKEKFATIQPNLTNFEKDLWLIEKLQKLANDQNAGAVLQMLDILDYVVLKEYDLPDPTILSQFSRYAINKGRNILINDYGAVVKHANRIMQTEPELLKLGLIEVKMEENINYHRGGNDYKSPHYYESNSYGSMIQKVLEDGSRKLPIQEVLNAFEEHFNKFKTTKTTKTTKNIEVVKLLKAGYLNLLSKVYQRHCQDQMPDGLKNELDSLNSIIEHLDLKEFDVYRTKTISTIDNYAANNQLAELERLTNNCHRNYLILTLGLMLKE